MYLDDNSDNIPRDGMDASSTYGPRFPTSKRVVQSASAIRVGTASSSYTTNAPQLIRTEFQNCSIPRRVGKIYQCTLRDGGNDFAQIDGNGSGIYGKDGFLVTT